MLGKFVTYRSTTEYTVADVLREHWDDYRWKHRVDAGQKKVVNLIMACRTATLGGKVNRCKNCGAWVFTFKSCRNRHCNQCQKFERAKWVEQQKPVQLPITYFHTVFTVDHKLNPLFIANMRVMLELLFEVVVKVLKEFGREKLGCELGVTIALHTWGQKMEYHFHLHCIVTGGGLSLDGQRFIKAKPRYLFDVVELSARYRDELLNQIEKLVNNGRLQLVGAAAGLDFPKIMQELRAKKWEVFTKPFDNPEAVFEYLSRYIHQVAISNHRLVDISDGKVTFTYYDNRERVKPGEKGKEKQLTLSAEEFIRRFLQHFLPKGFVRIRHYGLHHSSARAKKLPRCRQLLGLSPELPEVKELSLMEWLESVLGPEARCCPACGAENSLQFQAEFDNLSWWVVLLLSLVSEPTKQGVSV